MRARKRTWLRSWNQRMCGFANSCPVSFLKQPMHKLLLNRSSLNLNRGVSLEECQEAEIIQSSEAQHPDYRIRDQKIGMTIANAN